MQLPQDVHVNLPVDRYRSFGGQQWMHELKIALLGA